MRLDPTDIRYISSDAFRVLAAVEQGSKNHELVPTSLIASIAGSRSGGTNKALGELAKRKLVARVQNAKYDGYRLTYGGYDFLACRTLAKRSSVASVGNQIGTGKESDIYVVANDDGEQAVLKLHRLGRMSFRAIKSKRDYLKKGQSASWMYLSRIAAIKEFAFMKVLHDHDFPVPKPIDQSRHTVVMELIDAFPLRQISSVPSPGALYSNLMDLIVQLARVGLIHCDFNEFNILIRDLRSDEEKDRDDDAQKRSLDLVDVDEDTAQGGDEDEEALERDPTTLLTPILIDFPQMISTDHPDAEYYFNRDVACIRSFFRRRFNYESALYPHFSATIVQGERDFNLDVEVEASGYTKVDRKALDDYLSSVRQEQGDDDEDDDASVASDSSGEAELQEEDDNDGPLADLGGALRAKLPEADEDEGGEGSEETPDEAHSSEVDSGSDAESEDGSEDEREGKATKHQTVKRTRLSDKGVEHLVATELAKRQSKSERRHHGKGKHRPGRAKGSKAKTSKRQQIKDSSQF